MLVTPSITETANDIDGLLSFTIRGKVCREDMEAMARIMLDRFETWDNRDMLLVFADYEGAETGASLGRDALSAQVRALTNVRNYVTAGAPDAAGSMIETMSKLVPLDGRAFDTEAEAMAFLRAQPQLTRKTE